MHVEAARGEVVDRGLLDAQIEHGEVADPLGRRRGDLGGGDGHLGGEVLARHLRGFADEAQLLLGIQRGGLAGEHPAAHRARRAQDTRDGARVDPRDADDAVADERIVERLVGAPVGHDARGIAHDVAGDPDAARLGVLTVHTGVADVRRCLEHDLSGVGGVGEGLLVARHAGREDDLSEGDAAGAVGTTGVARPVLEHEDGGVGGEGGGGGHASVPVEVSVGEVCGADAGASGNVAAIASASARAEASWGRR